MNWRLDFQKKQRTLAQAIEAIPAGKHIFVASGASEPVDLVTELVRQTEHFSDNTVVHLLTLGPAPYIAAGREEHFRHNAFFIGPNVREAVHAGRADYTPVFLSQIPGLMRARRMPVDVALIQVSPPDAFGYVNVGVSVDVVLAAIESASLVVAEVNTQMPVIYGAGFLPASAIDLWVDVDHPLPEHPLEQLDAIAEEIGHNVAALIADGTTIQMGIGQIPDATLKALRNKRDLGVWTEMFSDGVLDLIENGNITGKNKTIHPGKVSSSFTFGSKRLYDYVDRNPVFTFHPSDFINDPIRIARQHRMMAINSALQIDLTGQVCADSIGTKFYSGIGGQVDFIRGASMCPGGKPIIAIRSTAKGGELSRIVANLSPGAGVVTSRGDVRFVVTEYGVADLLGKSIRERAMGLIAIAHPDFRAELLSDAKERRYVFADQLGPRANYPSKYEKQFTCRSGQTMLLRPIKVTDEEGMNALFYSLSDDTIYKRWMHRVKRWHRHELRHALDVDYARSMGFVVETVEADREPQIIAMAQYYTNPASNDAEVSFVVRDDWQRQGIGTQLFEGLVQVAREKGLDNLRAEVLVENEAMLRLFHKGGVAIHTDRLDDIYAVRIPLGQVAPVAAQADARG